MKTKKKRYDGFTAGEKSAMADRVKEMKAGKEDGESVLLAKLDEMNEADRALGKKLHAVIRKSAPSLESTTWYGMPAYAQAGKIVCFFQPAQKFKTRYATLGFSDKAKLDDGTMWPNSYAITRLTATDEATIGALLKKAIG
jgi:hypothetical protein